MTTHTPTPQEEIDRTTNYFSMNEARFDSLDRRIRHAYIHAYRCVTERKELLEEAKDVAILLQSYIAMRTHPSVLTHDPDYVKASRFLARLEDT